MNRNHAMELLFQEDFTTQTNGLPGSWVIEQNSDMKDVPAIRCGNQCIELLSAGNKYLPILPPVGSFVLRGSFFVHERSTSTFGLILCFGYDAETARGQYIAINRVENTDHLTLEYGSTRLNRYTAEQTKTAEVPEGFFAGKTDFTLRADDRGKLSVEIAGKTVVFDIQKTGSGVIALARPHFLGALKLLALSIEGEVLPAKKTVLPKTTIPLVSYQTHYPIYCDVTLSEYGSCMEAELTFRGSVPEYPAGEGNYHAIRADLLREPFFNVITKDKVLHHIIYNDTLVLVPPGLVPSYFFVELNKPCQWPFTRKVRFLKPETGFDLSVGFESYLHNETQNQVLTPAETIFNTRGEVLYSSLGLTNGKTVKVDFLSQEDKAILSQIPENDPRYEKAVRFAKKNHYFIEGESPQFQIELTSAAPLSMQYELLLEDAFFRKVKKVKFKQKSTKISYGVSEFNRVTLTCQALKDLSCKVWHLRIRSLDPSVEPLERHCAFEILPADKNAPVPPLNSGIPFLYNARTEVRGLMTDSFDPYLGESVNEGHYVTSTVFLPEAWKKYKMAPVVKAYRRKNFAWISPRTLDDPSFEANESVIRESDYINFNMEANGRRRYVTQLRSYRGENFRLIIDFMKKCSDPFFDIPALEKLCEEGGTLPEAVYHHLAENYWEAYLDQYCMDQEQWMRETLAKIRTVNPEAQLALYGPFAIYASACKGPDVTKLHGNTTTGPDVVGFWQFEDYPIACGYAIERGAFCLTACVMNMPEGSRIYPEIYSVNRLKRGCPDGAVFYAHPPFGDFSLAPDAEGKTFARRVLNYVYGSAYYKNGTFSYWKERGFQCCNFPEAWFDSLLKVWGFILDHEPEKPLRSFGYVAPNSSLKKTPISFIHNQGGRLVVRRTGTEDGPYLFEEAVEAASGNGFQLMEEEILTLSADQVHTLVLPPLGEVAPEIQAKIRSLHSEGVNLLCFENAGSLEDLFGVRDTGVKRTVTRITSTGSFGEHLREYCDDERCCGCYEATSAEVLLQAEIPVLTRQKNAKGYAVFFNVPPHLIKENRLHARGSHGKNGVSPVIGKACGQIMRFLEQQGAEVRVNCGRVLACRTQQGENLVILGNPSGKEALTCELTVRNSPEFASPAETKYPMTRIRKTKSECVYRVLLPANEYMFVLFGKQKRKRG